MIMNEQQIKQLVHEVYHVLKNEMKGYVNDRTIKQLTSSPP